MKWLNIGLFRNDTWRNEYQKKNAYLLGLFRNDTRRNEYQKKKQYAYYVKQGHYIEDFWKFVPVFCFPEMYVLVLPSFFFVYSFHRVSFLKSPLHSDFVW